MLEYLSSINPILLAFFATLITYSFTIAGSSVVFLCKSTNKTFMDISLGFAGGLMIAAAFFSLLSPARDMALKLNQTTWFIVCSGFVFGGLMLYIIDKISSKMLIKNENIDSKKRIFMLLFSITMHNIPEGLVIGLAFNASSFTESCLLTLGIAIQNFPEGSALSLPFRREGMNKKKAFFLGQISGIVEPIAGLLGALLAFKIEWLLPFLLALAAGAMIYVVIEEIIPESQTNKRKDLMALCSLFGFTLMMFLEMFLS